MKAPAKNFQTTEFPTLPQYAKGLRSPGRRRIQLYAFAVVVGFCFFYGLFYAYLSPYVIVQFAAPIAVLALLVLWALPEMKTAPTRSMEWLFFAFLAALILWPNYLAIALPGLPWITLLRLTGFPLMFVLLLSVSISPPFRRQVADTLKASPLLWQLLALFVATQVISIGFSSQKATSVQRLIMDQISWTGIFFVSVYVFNKPGRVERWAFMLWIMALIVGVIGFLEERQGQVLWANHVPSFLKIEDESVLRSLAGQTRAAIGVHRVQSTFGTSLGLAEYIALTMPFILHIAFGSYRWLVRAAAAVSIPFLFIVVVFTDSHLGSVGCMLSILAFVLAAAIRHWRRNRHSIFGPAVALSYPLFLVMAVSAVLAVGKLRQKILGGSDHAASAESRVVQYRSGLPMVLSRPLGHGVGMGAETLGYVSPTGVLTIDTYYLMIALEYGIVGFIAYYGMIAYAIYQSGRNVIRQQHVDDRDHAFLASAAIALTNFFIIKSVFSQQDNHPVVFMMLGLTVAMAARGARSVPGALTKLRPRAPSAPISTGR